MVKVFDGNPLQVQVLQIHLEEMGIQVQVKNGAVHILESEGTPEVMEEHHVIYVAPADLDRAMGIVSRLFEHLLRLQ